jgi:hypothetical protein
MFVAALCASPVAAQTLQKCVGGEGRCCPPIVVAPARPVSGWRMSGTVPVTVGLLGVAQCQQTMLARAWRGLRFDPVPINGPLKLTSDGECQPMQDPANQTGFYFA